MQSQGAPDQGQEQGQAQGGGQDQMKAIQDYVLQTDQALTRLAQVFARANPQAGEAMQQLNEQFRQIVKAVFSGGQAQQGEAPQQGQARPMAQQDQMQGGRPAQQAAY